MDRNSATVGSAVAVEFLHQCGVCWIDSGVGEETGFPSERTIRTFKVVN